jgi:hypothetical protein
LAKAEKGVHYVEKLFKNRFEKPEKTQGLFVYQYFRSYHRNGLLYFDHGLSGE